MYESATAFVESEAPATNSCIITDVRMPGVSGLDFQNTQAAPDVTTPVILITGHGDVAGAEARYAQLQRERQVMDVVVAGLMNKQAAAELRDRSGGRRWRR